MAEYARSSVPEFGDKVPGKVYVSRPGAYGLIFDDRGCIAVMETPRGCFLPGGGTEEGETPEETLAREVREECGFAITAGKRLCEASEYRDTPGHEYAIRKDCVFFAATVTSAGGAATEADHTLLWLQPQEAETRLAHGSQQWAVRKCREVSPPPGAVAP